MNVARLLGALTDLDARYRDLAGRVLAQKRVLLKARDTICCSHAVDRSMYSDVSAWGTAIKT
jgi:hypothetical protein